jgi:hypothetical protein
VWPFRSLLVSKAANLIVLSLVGWLVLQSLPPKRRITRNRDGDSKMNSYGSIFLLLSILCWFVIISYFRPPPSLTHTRTFSCDISIPILCSSFSGIMFPIKCKNLLPVDHLVINSVAVRGRLGPLTVWVSNEDQSRPGPCTGGGATTSSSSNNSRRRGGGNYTNDSILRNNNNSNYTNAIGSNGGEHRIQLHKRFWTKVYEKVHPSSKLTLTELVLDVPIKMKPGQTRCIYIHSTLPGDEAIVYDNSYYGTTGTRYEDDKLAIMTGRAHVSTSVFGQDPIWGWGNAWRDRREFVGRLEYGTVYKLWNPEVQPQFGSNFQNGARAILLCQRRWESPWSMLPDECVYYVLNMCRWDWFDDNSRTMKERKRREKVRLQKLALVAMQQEEEDRRQCASDTLEASLVVAAAAAVSKGRSCAAVRMDHITDEEEDSTPCAVSSNTRSSRRRIQDDDEEDDDNDENYSDDGIQNDEDDDDDDDDDDDVEMENEEEDDDEDEDDDIEEVADGDDNNDDDDDDDDDGESDPEDWEEEDEEDQYHDANRQQFVFQDADSDDEGDDEPNEDDTDQQETRVSSRQDWIRRHFARVHVLRALASMEDQAVAHVAGR